MLTLATRHLSVGDRLGKYEVLRHISTGSIAELYLARIVGIDDIDKLVVVKRLLPQYVSNSSFVETFLNEARLSATLHHQNIAQVHDIGLANGNFFFAMEYIHGEDLDRITLESKAKGIPISMDAALTLVSGLCAGLHHAHEKAGADGLPLQIVHRDISPSNILVSHAGSVKVVDFGVARAMSLQQRATRGGIKGKIAYVSPEQCRSSIGIDQRSDIFSIGVVLYQLTTGRLPFSGETEYEVLFKIVNEAPPPPRAFVSDYPQLLESIVMRALARDVEHRYSTALELQTELEDYAHEARLRISPLVLSRLMSALFPSGIKEWNHARADGESFLEERIMSSLIENDQYSECAVIELPELSASDSSSPRPGGHPATLGRTTRPWPQLQSSRCSTQGRARRPSTLQPPRAFTRPGIEGASARAATQRTRVMTIPPLRTGSAPPLGVPIVPMPPSAACSSDTFADGPPVEPVEPRTEAGEGDITRRLATVPGVRAPLKPSPKPLLVKPRPLGSPSDMPLPPLDSDSSAERTTDRLASGESTESLRSVRRPSSLTPWLLRGVALAGIALAVGSALETEPTAKAPSSKRAPQGAVITDTDTASGSSAANASSDEVPVIRADPRDTPDEPGTTPDVAEVDPAVVVTLRLDEPRPLRRPARRARTMKSSSVRVDRPRSGKQEPGKPGFDAWEFALLSSRE